MIMSENAKDIRNLGAASLKGHFIDALLVMLLADLVLSIPSCLAQMLGCGDFIMQLLNVYTLIMTGPVNLGMCYYFLRLFRNQKAAVGDMRFGLAYVSNALILYFQMYARIILWSFLFVIPGVIKAIEYSQAFFILADDPRTPIMECLNGSRRMMYGNRMHYFSYMIFFVALQFVALAPQYIYTFMTHQSMFTAMGIATAIEQLGGVFTANGLLNYLLSFLTVFVSMWRNSSNACYYDILSGGLIIQDI